MKLFLATENGLLMHLWYSALTRWVGAGVATPVVLLKCALDQVFFATQQDAIFLGLCASQRSDKLPAAIAEVKRNFLTTWLNDCAVWPLVNFIGFAWVPPTLQPTYMSSVQLFWQIYMSSNSNGTSESDETLTAGALNTFARLDSMHDDDHIIEELFLELDEDKVADYELSTTLLSQLCVH